METRKKLTLIVILVLILLLPFVILITRQRQDIRNRAAAPSAADRIVDIVLDPSSGNRALSETFEVNLKMIPVPNVTYVPLPANISVVGAEAEINVSDKFTINNNTDDSETIVGTVACLAPFRGAKYKKVEGQKVTVMCTLDAGTTLPITTGGRVFAKLNLTVKSDAGLGSAPLTFERTRVTRGDIPNQSPDVSTLGQNATFTVTAVAAGTPTPTPSPYQSGGYSWYLGPGGLSCDDVCQSVGLVCSSDNWNDDTFCHILKMFNSCNKGCNNASDSFAPYLTSSGGNNYCWWRYSAAQSCSATSSGTSSYRRLCACTVSNAPTSTPIPTITSGGPTTTPSPTPVGGEENIDIGTKGSLTINIGGGPTPTIDPNTPQIKFKVALLAQNTPEIKVRLKVVDLVAQITPGVQPADTCETAGPGMYYYKDVPMVYGGSDTQIGDVTYRIYQLKNDWLPLTGTTAGKIYSLAVKGEKHRSVGMVTNFVLNSGQPAVQDFDWTAKPLETGDLPNPNIGGNQDCTVNSVDLSLAEARLSTTDQVSLDIADVNYDGVVNGNDISKIVNTLSTRPDDD